MLHQVQFVAALLQVVGAEGVADAAERADLLDPDFLALIVAGVGNLS